MRLLVVGSRGSQLALRQTRDVIERLKSIEPGLSCEVKIIRTTGNRVVDKPLASVGGTGLFVKEIEQALLAGEINFAVHSAKDLPSEIDESLCIAAYPERENPADALISKAGAFSELPAGAVVGTSSVRRRAQLLHARPDLSITDLRGNLDTRLKKLDNGDYDAVVLACAGLVRMGWESRITQVLDYDLCLPMVAQGALAVQCRIGDPVSEALGALDHAATRVCVTAERAFLAGLRAGCLAPVAALARKVDGEIELDGLMAAVDGSKVVRRSAVGDAGSPEALGASLAQWFLASPARELLEQAKRDSSF